MQKRALLVGGGGQIGVATARVLVRAGFSVTIAQRGTRVLPADLIDHVRMLPLDRVDADALTAAARGNDLVLDCIAFGPADVAAYAPLVGELGSLVVISTASVYLGSNGTWMDLATSDDDFPIFTQPITEQHATVSADVEGYAPQKAAMERVLLAIDGLPVTILRPGAIHGPESPALREWFFIKRALDGRQRVALTDRGESRFATSATVMIAELVRLAADNAGQRVLNAVDEPAATALEIGQAVFAHLGHEAEFDLLARAENDRNGRDSATVKHPWAVPSPVELSMRAAGEQLGYVPVGSHRSTIGPAIDWMLGAVANAGASKETDTDTDIDTETGTGTGTGTGWRERFSTLASRSDADHWFDYEAEDALLDG